MVKRPEYRSGKASSGISPYPFQIIDGNFHSTYRSCGMSDNCKTIYMRGKYFIETGTAQTFNTWVQQIDQITRYTRDLLLERVAQLINGEERQQAVMLWLRICERADAAPIRFWWSVASLVWHISITGIAVYAFIDAITH